MGPECFHEQVGFGKILSRRTALQLRFEWAHIHKNQFHARRNVETLESVLPVHRHYCAADMRQAPPLRPINFVSLSSFSPAFNFLLLLLLFSFYAPPPSPGKVCGKGLGQIKGREGLVSETEAHTVTARRPEDRIERKDCERPSILPLSQPIDGSTVADSGRAQVNILYFSLKRKEA